MMETHETDLHAEPEVAMGRSGENVPEEGEKRSRSTQLPESQPIKSQTSLSANHLGLGHQTAVAESKVGAGGVLWTWVRILVLLPTGSVTCDS